MKYRSVLKRLYGAVRRTPVIRGVVRQFLPTTVVSINNDHYELHPRDNLTDRKIWLSGALPEPRSHAALEALLHSRRVLFVDIGANCGTYTIRAARVASADSTLIAVEPNPRMAISLRRNLELNALSERVAVHECALAAEVGEATLRLAAGNSGQGSLRQVAKTRGTITVPTKPLAGILPAAHDGMLFAIKIDVEGFEDEVLCPYLDSAPEGGLPNLMLVETEHAAAWRKDVVTALTRRGYAATFNGEGNTLFQRSA